jgi:DNA-binding NarL/FixJ family response regulator
MERGLEGIVTMIALAIVLIGAITDFFEDFGNNASWPELALDVGFSMFVAGALIYIWIHRPQATSERNRALERAMHSTREDLAQWKAKAANLLRGLGDKINDQFDDWKLTDAEKEVALLLVKGLSLKEVAAIRGTSEKTVRQQASRVYAKSGVESRAELAAFFLEDLLLPRDAN